MVQSSPNVLYILTVHEKERLKTPYFYSIELKADLSKIILVPDIAFFLLKYKFKCVCDTCIADVIEVKTFIMYQSSKLYQMQETCIIIYSSYEMCGRPAVINCTTLSYDYWKDSDLQIRASEFAELVTYANCLANKFEDFRETIITV